MVGFKIHADTLNFQRIMPNNGNQTLNLSGRARKLGSETSNALAICFVKISISTLRLIKTQRKLMKGATSTMASQTSII